MDSLPDSPRPAPGDGGDDTPRPQPAVRPDDRTTITPAAAARPVVATSMEEIGRALEGHSLGPYRLERFVGGGGMGAVFRAVDTTLDRVVAVKVLSRQQSSDVDLLRRFKNEAQLAARLDHENIGRVHAVGSDEGWHYIVFEFIEGTNLRDLVVAEGPLDVARALRFTIQVAAALGHAADRGVVHRDIKPSNIIVTPAGRARLVDMGLARLPTMAGAPDLTASGMTLGTFDYISPEQARDPRAADVRSDLYSLGCTLFFMLTGKPPFAEGTLVQKLLQHQQSEPPAVTADRPDVPAGLAEAIARLLEKRPEDRYQSPADLVADLVAVAAEEGIDLEADRPLPTPVPALAGTGWHTILPWAVPVAGLLVLVIGLRVVRPWIGPSPAIDRRGPSEDRRSAAPPVSPVAAGRPAPSRSVWRVVDAPRAAHEVATLAEAVDAAGDGDVIECGFTGSRDTSPLSLAGRSLTIRSAEGHEPSFRVVRTDAPDAPARASIEVSAGSLVCDGIGLRDASARAVLFAVSAGAALEVRRATLDGGADRRGTASGVRAEAAILEVREGVGEQSPARVRFVDVRAAGVDDGVIVAPGTALELTWEGGACVLEGRFVRLDGAPRGARSTAADLVLADATFACREGFAALLDSPAGPRLPTLRVNAERCRFLVGSASVFVEQAGIGSPADYRDAVRWTDSSGNYEGGQAFRRIDGAAEREELPFPVSREGGQGPRGPIPWEGEGESGGFGGIGPRPDP